MDEQKLKDNISNNIKHLRTQKNLSQEKLGAILNYGGTAVSNWEKGIRMPDSIDLFKLANYFGVAFEDIIEKDLRVESYEDLSKEKAILDNVRLLDDEEREKILAILDVLRK